MTDTSDCMNGEAGPPAPPAHIPRVSDESDATYPLPIVKSPKFVPLPVDAMVK